MSTFSTEELHRWGDEFEQRGYARYMTFVQFMRDPAGYVARYDGADGFRPLLPAQRRIATRLRVRVTAQAANQPSYHVEHRQ